MSLTLREKVSAFLLIAGLFVVAFIAAVIRNVIHLVGSERLLAGVLAVFFAIPAPGHPLDPTTWLSPQNGVWPTVMALSQVAMLAGGVVVLGLVARALSLPTDDPERRQEVKQAVRTGAMVGATWTILPFALHLVNEIALAFAPDPELLLDALGATAAGGLVLGVLTWIQPLFVLIGLLASQILRWLILVGFLAWPIAWPLRAVDHEFLHGMGRSITAVFTVAVAAKLLQAIAAFGLVFLTTSLESLLMRTVVFIVGVVGVFVVLPLTMVRHAERVMTLPFMVAPTPSGTRTHVKQSAERVRDAHQRVDSGRERLREWRSTDPQTTVTDFIDDEDDHWWNGWVDRDVTFHRPEWGWNWTWHDRTMTDGSPGPESEGPDDISDRGTDTDRDHSRWHNR